MFTIERRAVTDSTNDDAAAILGDTSSAGRVIVAEYQRAGRGRRERAWIAPPGSSLLFTAILHEPIDASALWAATLWTALGVANGIEDACGTRVALQWPNDLLLGERKCCGILCVSRVAGSRAWLGCGVGLNVMRPDDDASRDALAAIVPPPAFLGDAQDAPVSAKPMDGRERTDTRGASEQTLDRETLLAAILARFEASARDLTEPHAVARAWEARASLAGTRYRIKRDTEAEPFDAIARRLSDDGSLIVERAGREVVVSLADARVLRD